MEEYSEEILFAIVVFAVLLLAASIILIKIKVDNYIRHQCKYGNVKAGSSIKVYKNDRI
jgi:hypothetical protein